MLHIDLSVVARRDYVREASIYADQFPMDQCQECIIEDQADEEWSAYVLLIDGTHLRIYHGNGHGEWSHATADDADIPFDDDTEIVPGWTMERLVNGLDAIATEEF